MTRERSLITLLRNVPVRRLVRALEREGFEFKRRKGSQRHYRHSDGRRVVIHYHGGSDTQPPFVLGNLLIGTHWTEEDLRRLKLIK